MPDRPEAKRLRWFLIGATTVLSVLVLVLLGLVIVLREDLNETRTRLTALEVKGVAEEASQRTAEVAACYASARGRPRLIVILRLLAATAERDPVARAAVEEFIMDYENATPTVKKCDQVARRNGLDPKDFPPTNGRGETTR